MIRGGLDTRGLRLHSPSCGMLIQRRKLYPSNLRRYLTELRATRHFADYHSEMVSLRMAKDALRMAEEFVSAVEKRIAP